jgi:hypothetical protein
MKAHELSQFTCGTRNPHTEFYNLEKNTYACKICRKEGAAHELLKDFWDELLLAQIDWFWANATAKEVFDVIGEPGQSVWGQAWALKGIGDFWFYTKPGKMANQNGWFYVRRQGNWRRIDTLYDSGQHWFDSECCPEGHSTVSIARRCGRD